MTQIQLLTHTDLDGAGCALLATIAFPEQLLPIKYLQPKDVDEAVNEWLDESDLQDVLLIADLCPSRGMVEKIQYVIAAGRYIFISDHHDSTKWLAGIKGKNFRHFSNMCGASNFLGWLVLQRMREEGVDDILDEISRQIPIMIQSDTLQKLIGLIDVYDRWVLDSPLRAESEKLNRIFRILGMELFVQYFALDHNAHNGEPMRVLGEVSAAKEKRTVAETLEHQLIPRNIHMDAEGRRYACLCISDYASQIGHAVLDADPTIDYVVMHIPTIDVVSLRSRKGGVNVAEIASSRGGGGHVEAAGFTLGERDKMKAAVIQKIASPLV